MKHSERPKPETVDEYMSLFSGRTLEALNELRKIIHSVAPQAVETISYAIPAYKIDGKAKVYFAGYDHHVSIYPLLHEPNKKLAERLKPHISGRGTLKFPLDKPLPRDLIIEVVTLMTHS